MALLTSVAHHASKSKEEEVDNSRKVQTKTTLAK